MMKKLTLMIAIGVVLCSPMGLTAVAQSGADTNPTLHLLSDTQGIDVKEAKITFEAAQALVTKEFPTQANDSTFYCMIHVMRWKNFGSQGENRNAATSAPAPVRMPSIDVQNWYTYNKDEKKNFEGIRIYGSRNVGFLYVHINARGNLNLSAAAASKLANPGKNDLPFLISNLGRRGTPVEAGIVVNEFTQFNYTWEEKSKLPKLATDARQLLGFLTAQGGPEKPPADFTEETVNLYGSSSKAFPLKYKTSDITVKLVQLIDQGAGQVDTNQISAQTYDNEGRTRFDLSLGIPVTRVKELTFNASDNTVRSSKTDRQHVYAFMNIFLRPIDTKGLKVNSTPHLLFGLPITGKPLDSPFIGGAYGYNKIQVFAGVVFNRERRPASLKIGDTATPGQLESDLTPRYKPKFMMGINFPVKQIVEALSSKK